MAGKRVAVVGGGASGMMAALEASKAGNEVHLFERNEKLGKKLYITGKGRCNVTNAAGRDTFFQNVVRNPRFLFSAYAACGEQDVMRLLEQAGVPVKVERGDRVFPVSDKSSDVLAAFARQIDRAGVTMHLNAHVTALATERGEAGPRIAGVMTGDELFACDAVILATGGLSYPSTGSTGDGHRFLAACGHTVVTPRGALVPLETVERWPAELAGLTLKNVRLTAHQNGRTVYDEQGEMLFTHFGVSGPLVLSCSSYLDDPAGAELWIDLKPALSFDTLNARLLRELASCGRQHIKTALGGLLPARLLITVLAQAGVDADMPAAELKKSQREDIIRALKALTLHVAGTRGFSEAVITRGGVDVREIAPGTLASKKVDGLYVCGELLDVDALTGGFNLQIAWSTGALAGRSV